MLAYIIGSSINLLVSFLSFLSRGEYTKFSNINYSFTFYLATLPLPEYFILEDLDFHSGKIVDKNFINWLIDRQKRLKLILHYVHFGFEVFEVRYSSWQECHLINLLGERDLLPSLKKGSIKYTSCPSITKLQDFVKQQANLRYSFSRRIIGG